MWSNGCKGESVCVGLKNTSAVLPILVRVEKRRCSFGSYQCADKVTCITQSSLATLAQNSGLIYLAFKAIFTWCKPEHRPLQRWTGEGMRELLCLAVVGWFWSLHEPCGCWQSVWGGVHSRSPFGFITKNDTVVNWVFCIPEGFVVRNRAQVH